MNAILLKDGSICVNKLIRDNMNLNYIVGVLTTSYIFMIIDSYRKTARIKELETKLEKKEK